MKFQKIEIENFASYYGKTEPIILETDKTKPLVIFVGHTGFGKTSFFDAINWALYGLEYEKDIELKKNRNILDYVNETALSEGQKKNQKVQMSVSLFFEHNGIEYYIAQTLVVNAIKDNNQIKAEVSSRNTNLREIKHKGDHESIPYTKTFLDEILPNNVKGYFLFDSDRIHNLAKPGNSQEVQDAIYRVVDLEIIRNAREHLEDAAMEFSKKAGKAAKGKLAEIEEEYQRELDFQSKLKQRVTEIKKEKQAIKNQIDIIEAKFSDLTETKALQERTNQINKDLVRVEDSENNLKNRMRDNAAIAVFGLVKKPLIDLRNLLKDKRVKGEIPKHIRETFFNDLFDIKECICGTPFKEEEGDVIYEALKKRVEVEKNRSSEEDYLIDLIYLLNQVEAKISETKTQIELDDDGLGALELEKKKYILEKQEIEKQLEELPGEDIGKLLSQRKQREERNNQLIAESTTIQGQITTSEEKLKELDKLRKELGKKQEEASSLHLRSELSKKAAQEVEALYDQFAEDSRKSVEKLTVQEFKKFVISSSNYKVGLNKDYELEVLDSNGNRALQRLSMGQTQCLSLAFITAISRVSEKYPPLVIDMPFGRLDPVVHESICKRLPELAHQIILFLIPKVEWNSETQPLLSKYSNHMYELNFDSKFRQTTITPIN